MTSTITTPMTDAEAIASLDAAQISGDITPDRWGSTKGIYLTGYADRERVARGGGGTLNRFGKFRGWQGVAPIPGDTRTTADALRIAGLDWRVVQVPVAANFALQRENIGEKSAKFDRREEGDSFRMAPAYVANVREDTGDILGIVGKNWRGPQNDEAFRFVDDLVDDDSAKWLGAGTSKSGTKTWGMIQFGRDIIPGGDVDEKCVPLGLIQNGFDGSCALRVTVAPFREACTNGMTIPLPGYRRDYTIRHTSGVQGRIQEARQVLGIMVAYMDAFQEKADEMIVTRFTQAQWERFVEEILPLPEKADASKRSITTIETKREALLAEIDAPDLANVRGTVWGAFNAVTSFADWNEAYAARSKNEPIHEKTGRKIEEQFGGSFKSRAYSLLVG